MKATARLREILKAPGVIQAAGVGDAGQARIVESVGYKAVYMSGAYVNVTHGVPDGTLGLHEIVTRVREIASRVNIPLIADGDDGFGDISKVIRTVQEYELAGAAALHLEDMSTKKYGKPMPVSEMTDRLHAAVDARKDADFVVIARTDAMSPWGQKSTDRSESEQESFERLMAYAEAGADVLMPLYASIDWLKKYGPLLPKPLLVLRQEVQANSLESCNVKIVSYSTNMLAKTFPIVRKLYAEWLAAGKSPLTEEDLKNREAAHVVNGLHEREKILKKYYK